MLQLGCPIVPNPTPTRNTSPGYGMDHFAWKTFIALNWPAVSGSDVRGIPDLSSNFDTALPSDLLVWETLKEKREVFYRGSCSSDPNISCALDSDCEPANGSCNRSMPPGQPGRSAASLMWNGPPQYGPQGDDLSVFLCADAPPGTMPSRILTSSTKLHFDSLDETLEVQSEALESFTELCAGYNVVDPETTCTEVDPPVCCTIQGRPVGPRVWKGGPSMGGRPVLYEVKVNYDYFKYVTDPSHMYYLDSKASPAAASAEFLLPYRTNSFTGGRGGGPLANPSSVLGYDAQKCFLAHGYDSTGEFPCAIGAVHLKAAWILLEDEDPSAYHTADASYFKANPDDPNELCQTSGTFGLVGLHIIQRTHQVNPPSNPPMPPDFNAIGGAYIFATWEHVDNDTAGFRYANYHFSTKDSPASGGFYPATTDTLALTRMFDLLDATKMVNSEVHHALDCPDSGAVWCNYRLIGTQFKPAEIGDPTITNGEQPYYLANLVLESNVGLQMFQGLPPNITPISMFSSVPSNTTPNFEPDMANSFFNRSPKNMGGCLGCHGVAQLNGYTFSFMSQGGQRGTGIDGETPGQFGPAPTSRPDPVP